MAQPDNTLGAPTEGLGQKVTFAFDPQQSSPQLQLGGEGNVQDGVSGGTVGVGQTQTIGVKDTPNPTLDLIMKVGDAILAPRIKQARQDAFFTGMQRAMQGEAVADIAQDQPWYTKIFGDSDVVEGARAYTGHTVAQTQVAAMEDAMPQLRKMGPQDAQAYFVKAVNDHLTGDTPTDLSIMQSMTQALPAVMRRQAKEHYGWQQEQASTAETAAFRAGATNLQAAAQGLDGTPASKAVFDQQTQAFVRSIAPVAGRDEKSYLDSMTKNLTAWGYNGNFHALNALEKAGFLDVLKPEQRLAVSKAQEQGETRLRTKYSFDWNDDLAKLEAVAHDPPVGTTANDVAAQVDALNKRYSDTTGSTQGLISPTMRAAYVSGSALEITHARDREATRAATNAAKLQAAGDKAGAQAATDAVYAQAASDGSLGTLVTNPKYSPEPGYVAAESQFRAKADPANPAMLTDAQTKFLGINMRTDFTVEPIKRSLTGQITGALAAGQATPDFLAGFANYSKLREQAGVNVADSYYAKYKAEMGGFYNDVKSGITPEGAFRERFVYAHRNESIDTKQLTAVTEAIGADKGFASRWWSGETEMQPGTARRIGARLAYDASRLAASNGGDYKDAVSRAFYSAKAGNHLEVVGGYDLDIDKDQKPLFNYLTTASPNGATPIATNNVGQVFANAVKMRLYGNGEDLHGMLKNDFFGTKPNDISVIRLQDAAGVPQYHIQAVYPDGSNRDGTISGNEVFKLDAAYKEHVRTHTAGIKNTSLQFGAPMTTQDQPTDNLYGRMDNRDIINELAPTATVNSGIPSLQRFGIKPQQ